MGNSNEKHENYNDPNGVTIDAEVLKSFFLQYYDTPKKKNY
jgi:hypothetical protein